MPKKSSKSAAKSTQQPIIKGKTPRPARAPKGLPGSKTGIGDSLFAVPQGFLYFEEHGPAAGFPLVFMYGLGCSISHWQWQMDYFRSAAHGTKMRVLWADYRGHGRSSRVTGGKGLTLDQMVDDHLSWLQKVCPQGAVLLGQSLGGTVALKMASKARQQNQDLVKGVVLIGAPGRGVSRSLPFGRPSQLIWKFMEELNATKRPSLAALNRLFVLGHVPVRELVRVMGFNPLRSSSADVDRYTRELAKTDFNIFFDLTRDLEGFDLARLRPVVEQPVLIIAGKKDTVVPTPEIEYVAKHLPGAVTEWFPNGSHCPHHDDPQAVNFRIELFLKECGYRS